MRTRKKQIIAILLVCLLALSFTSIAGSAAPTEPNFDIYLKLDGIEGDAAARDYEKWIPLFAVQFGLQNDAKPNGGSAAGKTTASPIAITKSTDAATVPLFVAAASGKRMAKGTIAFVKPGESKGAVLSYELGNVLISSYTSSNGYESLTLAYDSITLSYSPQKADGSLGTPIKGGWNFAKNTKL